MKKFLTLVFLIPCLLGCDRLSDNEVKALRCELWRKDGGSLNKQIYKDITGKYGCVSGVDPQRHTRKSIGEPCDPNEQDSLLQEVNTICDALLNQNQSE